MGRGLVRLGWSCVDRLRAGRVIVTGRFPVLPVSKGSPNLQRGATGASGDLREVARLLAVSWEPVTCSWRDWFLVFGNYGFNGACALSAFCLIVSDPGVCGGKPVVRGTRVPVQYLLELWDEGWSIEAMHEQFPTVSKGLIGRVLQLLKENRTIEILH